MLYKITALKIRVCEHKNQVFAYCTCHDFVFQCNRGMQKHFILNTSY